MSLQIGIDLGTSGVKAVVIEDGTRVHAEAGRPIAVSVPQLGWSEQEADLWVEAAFDCLDRLAAEHGGLMGSVEAIGLSGQMLACLPLGADLRPLRPAMLWNDQRALAECAELSRRAPDIGTRANGAPDPGITAPKIMWLARHEPEVLARARMLLLPKDYLRLALTGEVASEPTDAGGTGLFDCRKGAWADDLCAAAGWDPSHLPPVVMSWAPAGGLRDALARRWGMRAGLPVAAGAGDNMASTLGVGAALPGDAVLTVGTSGVACIVDAAFHPGPHRAILTSAHSAPDTFLSMGVVMSATAALDWAGRLTRTSAAELAGEAETWAATARLEDAPVVLPCLNGIRTPLNRPDAMGRIDGLHPGVTPAMLGYGVMEGVAFQLADCVGAQIEAGAVPERIALVGGGARSLLWARLIATAVGMPVSLPPRAHVSGPAGAARLAAVASGAEVTILSHKGEPRSVIDPDPGLAPRLRERRERFRALLPAPGAGAG